MLQEVMERLEHAKIVASSQLEMFKQLAEKAEQAYNAKAKEELELEDAPEDFKGTFFYS